MRILQGVDLVKVSRMEQTLKRSGKKFLNRIFSPEEQKYCESKRMKCEHYAARFAAKEAVLKALKIKPRKGQKFSGIEVRRQATGKPFIELDRKICRELRISPKAQIELSLAHEREYAIATVVVVIP